MSIRRITSLILILLLNLIVGFILIEPFNISVILKTNFANKFEIFSESNSTKKTGGLNSSNLIKTDISPEWKISFPIHLEFLINPEDLCSRGTTVKSKVTLVILVCTAVSNFNQRNAIRNTWGSVASTSNNTEYVRLAFLLGWTQSQTLQKQVQDEATKYSDIIQQDFIDSYKNLTLKSLMLLKWVSEYCPNVQYVLKTDDDVYINIPNLIRVIVQMPVKKKVMYGVLFRKSKPDRNPTAKWFVPRNQFQGDMFPDYLSGTAYVMSRDVAPKLLEASATIPFLVMEDVYITGLCASEYNIRRYNVRGFAHWKRPPNGCAFKNAITGHHVSIDHMYKIWNELQRKPLVCRIVKKKS